MSRYYVNDNAQYPSGDHEVHKTGCPKFPNHDNLTYLGNFSSCRPAVRKAKQIYRMADGCYYCSRECHTR